VKVRDLTNQKPVTIGPEHSLRDAAILMAKHQIGSAVVHDGDLLAGILTERDVLRAVAAGAEPGVTPVDAFMTRDVVSCGPDWDAVDAAAEMARRHIRHLIVYSSGTLLGVVSVRDVLEALLPADQRE
jgi:CBS domain-containing protein